MTFLTNFGALSSNLVPDFTYLSKFSFYRYIKKSTFLTICSCSKILKKLKCTFYGLTIYEINVIFYADFENNAEKIVSLILFKLLGWIHKNLMWILIFFVLLSYKEKKFHWKQKYAFILFSFKWASKWCNQTKIYIFGYRLKYHLWYFTFILSADVRISIELA